MTILTDNISLTHQVFPVTHTNKQTTVDIFRDFLHSLQQILEAEMFVPACQDKFDPLHCIKSITSGITGKQEEVRATTPRLQRGNVAPSCRKQEIKQHTGLAQQTAEHQQDWMSAHGSF